jgi:hypothetical protein
VGSKGILQNPVQPAQRQKSAQMGKLLRSCRRLVLELEVEGCNESVRGLFTVNGVFPFHILNPSFTA